MYTLNGILLSRRLEKKQIEWINVDFDINESTGLKSQITTSGL